MSKNRYRFAVQLLVIAAIFFLGSPSSARSLAGDSLTVDVVPDLSTFSFVNIDTIPDPSPGEPFVIQGNIFEKGTTNRIGDFLCRGFFIKPQTDGDFTFVHQSFEIDNMGTIHIEGNEPGGVPGIDGLSRAIVGATGIFIGTGQAKIEPMPTQENPFIFRITFNFAPLTSVGSPRGASFPKSFGLSQNYPNPFNPDTKIEYELPELGPVTLRIFNLMGQEVRTLLDGVLPAGQYSVQWDGKDNHGRDMATGTYLYRLETKDFTKARKMLLVH